jgi:predicted signal transduction protein with EAL and GGDEF domain
MKRIVLKSGLAALLFFAASLLVFAAILPALDVTASGTVWLGLAVVGPCSAYTFWQKERLAKALEELRVTHSELAAAHRALAEKARRDDMTGMLNRESFFAVLDRMRQQEQRGALLIIDADHSRASTTVMVT